VLDAAAAGAHGELHPLLRADAANDNGDASSSTAAQSAREIFGRYARSFAGGEFNVTRYVQSGEYAWPKVFFYGAIDWRTAGVHVAVSTVSDAGASSLRARARKRGLGPPSANGGSGSAARCV
jgi:hypothetical protein